MANELRAGYIVLVIYWYFLRKYLTFEGRRRRKNENFCSGAGGEGIGAAGGRTGWRERRRRGAAGLVVVMVLNKSKSFVVPLSIVLFYVHSKLFCTDVDFAPAARVPRVPGEGRQEGSQAEGLTGRYPPLDSYGWDDKSV